MRESIRSHRTRVTAMTAVFVVLAALAPSSVLAKTGGTDRPVKGTSVGTVTVTVPVLGVTADATGVATHLGRYTGRLVGAGTVTPQSTVEIHGTFFLVAANGDQLTGPFTAVESAPSGGIRPITTFLTVTGGTGRFARASGTITAALQATTPVFDGVNLIETVEGPLTGRITY